MNTSGTLAAIVLAAGTSQRMGEANKLLLDAGGRPVLARVLQAFAGAPYATTIVVTGAQHEQVAEVATRAEDVHLAHNPAYRTGMASSIRCGIQAAGRPAAGYAICPGDLPLLTAPTVRRLGEAFATHVPPRIVVPICDERRGHPVLFDRSFRDALLQLHGDRGARALLRRHTDAIVTVDVEDDGIYRDVDTPDALRAARRHLRHRARP
jgi:molybdenum cofactor cytidylyltransferase